MNKKKTTNELLKSIEEAIERGRYFFTNHALQRSIERRNVNAFQVIRILRGKDKVHEPKKDTYHPIFDSWNYSLVGRSIDDERVRIILSFDEEDMLIITVMNLEEQ